MSAPVTSLRNLPVNLFASVMTLAGLALAWRSAARQFHADLRISNAIGILALAVFALLTVAYLAKLLKYPEAVRKEFTHPVAGHFFGTINVAVLLVSAVIAPFNGPVSQVIWSAGAAGSLVLGFAITSRLLRGGIDSGSAVPAWLISGVAILDLTATGGTMPMVWAHELNHFALGVGSVLALVFFTLIISRLIHHPEKLAVPMVPSLMILTAPFTVGFLAYTNFTQRIDDLAAMLFYFGLFLFLILVFRIFRRSVPFAPGWWAVGFPLAALTNAALKYAGAVQLQPLTWLAVALLVFSSGVVAVLFYRTLRIVLDGSLLRG